MFSIEIRSYSNFSWPLWLCFALESTRVPKCVTSVLTDDNIFTPLLGRKKILTSPTGWFNSCRCRTWSVLGPWKTCRYLKLPPVQETVQFDVTFWRLMTKQITLYLKSYVNKVAYKNGFGWRALFKPFWGRYGSYWLHCACSRSSVDSTKEYVS